jgi:hypothetical protein
MCPAAEISTAPKDPVSDGWRSDWGRTNGYDAVGDRAAYIVRLLAARIPELDPGEIVVALADSDSGALLEIAGAPDELAEALAERLDTLGATPAARYGRATAARRRPFVGPG